jgi:hypothetical protein
MPLHDNRKHSLPRNGGKHQVFSRTTPLSGKLNTQYGSGQSMAVSQGGVDPSNPETWPKKWPASGRVLNVPKCVILSSFPYWAAWWPAAYFYGPSDVIGISFTTGLIGNYYYWDQWNFPDAEPHDSTAYSSDFNRSQSRWLNQEGYVFDDMPGAGKKGLYTDEYDALIHGAPLPPQPPYGINECWQPPAERFSQLILGRLENPYYIAHQQCRANFAAAKLILESDPVDPIYVIDAAWCPTKLAQIRNAYLTKIHEEFNRAHGNGPDIADSIPCYSMNDICWGPSYPDLNNSSNSLPFPGAKVPWLVCGEPGFGTNVLHLYVGHANMAYSPASSIFDYQAWPLSPEGSWIGPIFNGSYLGAGLPFFKGRRSVWRDAGLDFGYMVHGAAGLYNTTYGPLVQAAAEDYKRNSLKYRKFATKLYTYPQQWAFNWNFQALWGDQKSDCGATQFYFGFDFDEFSNRFSNEDNWYQDLSGYFGGVKIAAHYGNVPDSNAIRTAISSFYPPIRTRVEGYYNGIEPGTKDFFDLAIANNGLADYDVSSEGLGADIMTTDGIVETVRRHFRDNP